MNMINELMKARAVLKQIGQQTNHLFGCLGEKCGVVRSVAAGPVRGAAVVEVTLYEGDLGSSEPLVSIRVETDRIPRLIIHENGAGLDEAIDDALAENLFLQDTPDGESVYAIRF